MRLEWSQYLKMAATCGVVCQAVSLDLVIRAVAD
jgi:hypothetical protein